MSEPTNEPDSAPNPLDEAAAAAAASVAASADESSQLDDPPSGLAPYRFALRALAFGLVLVGAVFLLEPLVMSNRLLRRVVLLENAYDLERFQRSPGSLLYLGDSVVGWGGDKEGREQVLPALAANASGLPVTDASHPAYGPRCFKAQVTRLARGEARPRALLLGLSLASFGPRRAENPSWHFGLRRSLLESGRYLPRRALAVFEQGFGARTQDSYEALEVSVAGSKVGRVGDLRGLPPRAASEEECEERYRQRLLCDYATPIEDSSEWAPARELFRALSKLEVPRVVYLTPYDHEAARRLLRPSQRELMRANVEALVRLAAREGITLHDLSQVAPGSAFDTPAGVTAEHLFPSGRVELIKRLEPLLRAALKE